MEFTKGASSHIEEGKAAEAGASTEERYLALSQWWQRHCKAFSLWFLSLPATQQQVVLQRCCPDIPKSSGRAAARASSSGGADAGGVIPSLKATDIILPELSLESLLASNGRLLILFVTRICTSPSKMMREDIQFLTTLHSTSLLPSLSNNAFVSLDCPFMDPLDAEENVQALPKDASELLLLFRKMSKRSISTSSFQFCCRLTHPEFSRSWNQTL